MKNILIFLLLGVFATGLVFAEEGIPERVGNGVKKGGEAAGRGIQRGADAAGRGIKKGGEAAIRGVKKAGAWVGKKMQAGGNKLEKTSESK